MKVEDKRTCPGCGNEFSVELEFCPVCTLRKALPGGVMSGESSISRDTVTATSQQAVNRFEHYELMTGEDGKPIELGRGAMGITYKAFDVDLQCPVTLKVISERFLGDESARLRFLREARAAARLRHSYRQGSSGNTSSADEFLDAALTWFGDPDPRLGTSWEKGERLAKLISHRRTLLVLDGLEPLQNPPGPQEGRLREPSLQALLRELAAFNKGLCVITTRLPIADIADYERTSALRRDLDQLSGDAGAKLLRGLGVKGDEAELLSASSEFNGHCLALTLLGSYLTDAHDGDIRRRNEISERLSQDVRQGVHVQKVMESYQSWLGEGPELSVLRILGLFDRPADEKALEALLKPPAIPGLTKSLTN